MAPTLQTSSRRAHALGGVAWPVLPFLLACSVATGCNKGKDEDDSGKPVGGNNNPVSDAGNDTSFPAAKIVPLDGCGSYDPDGDTLTFSWGFDHTPEGSALADAENPFPENYSTSCESSFSPDLTGTYVVSLVVTDARGAASAPDYVVITIDGGDKPIANAGTDQNGLVGLDYTLDGSGSHDAAKRPLTYAWAMTNQPSSSSATLTGADTVSPSFTADQPGLYTVALVVDNGILVSDPDTVNVNATVPDPAAPIADAGPDVTAEDCSAIPLNGSNSNDPEGASLIYSWALQSKPAGSTATNDSIADRTAEITTFYADMAGDFVISLAVFDGKSWSTPDTITVHAIERVANNSPTVFAGIDLSFSAGTAECEATAYGYECDECPPIEEVLGGDATIADSETDPYTMLWEVVGGEATIDDPYSLVTDVTLEGAAPAEPSACVETFYTFKLSATDCPQTTSSDEVLFTVLCCGVAAP